MPWILVFFILFSSCAQLSNSGSNQKKSVKKLTQREKAIELYKKLRWENWKKIQNRRKADQRKKNKYKKPKKVSRSNKIIRRYKKKVPPPPIPLNEEIQKELKIEISQNLSFFCMKKRKDNRFENESECHAYTQFVLDKCQEKYPAPWVNRKIVTCVKSNLR